MSFYQQIAPYYHHIFKINVQQLDFVKCKLPDKNCNIVDIGCGIGTLSFELNKHYHHLLGIDMDAEMIRVANSKKNATSKTVQFKQLSMLDLTSVIAKNTIDGIVCFGNTLVHLNSLDEIEVFLQQAKTVLKCNGKLLLQIVNYDRILAKNIAELPLINNNEIIFERNYKYHPTTNKIDFNTCLTVKKTQQTIKNSIALLPVLKEELTYLLTKVGFQNYDCYGNFKQDNYSIDSPALIIEAW